MNVISQNRGAVLNERTTLERVHMDFLEKILGLAPDGGSGTYELSILITVATLIVARLICRKRLGPSRRWGVPLR
jgi:hypothetical protein